MARRRKLETEIPIKHLFDPNCECMDCLAKRGKTFQYISLIPNLPDGSAGIYTEAEGPEAALRQHLWELELMGLGVGKGRAEGQRDLEEKAAAILQARAVEKAAVGEGAPPPDGPPAWVATPSGPKMRPLLQALWNKGNVPIETVLQAVYGTKSPKTEEALRKLVIRTNQKLTQDGRQLEIARQGETLILRPV
jgi:hypothetical protein